MQVHVQTNRITTHIYTAVAAACTATERSCRLFFFLLLSCCWQLTGFVMQCAHCSARSTYNFFFLQFHKHLMNTLLFFLRMTVCIFTDPITWLVMAKSQEKQNVILYEILRKKFIYFCDGIFHFTFLVIMKHFIK